MRGAAAVGLLVCGCCVLQSLAFAPTVGLHPPAASSGRRLSHGGQLGSRPEWQQWRASRGWPKRTRHAAASPSSEFHFVLQLWAKACRNSCHACNEAKQQHLIFAPCTMLIFHSQEGRQGASCASLFSCILSALLLLARRCPHQYDELRTRWPSRG
jgi:hypothetical protein